ncbi:hypothetical protein [Streptomyces sp. KL116D]|uniref:hypothetical protein n=1 Tax=Streptomyces sp. KL116D TaxID=3045152 RepID=UPI0035565CF0
MGISSMGTCARGCCGTVSISPEEDADDDVMCCGFDGFDVEASFWASGRWSSLYANRSRPGGFDPPDQPDHPFWRTEWIPFLSDQDGWRGKFVDVRDGRVSADGS